MPKILHLPARALLALALAATFLAPVGAQSLEVKGQAGYLGEWELAAELAPSSTAGTTEYLGPLTLTHVGLCTQDGPKVKTGEIRLRMSGSPSRVTATLSFDGTACSFSGVKEQAYDGFMSCSDRNKVPLRLWLSGEPSDGRGVASPGW